MQQQRRNLWRWISSNQRRQLRYGIQRPRLMPPLIMRHFGGWYTITSQLQRCCSSTHPIPYPITGTGSNNRWKLLNSNNSNNIPSPSVRTVRSSLLFAQLSTTTTTTTTTTTSDNNNNNNDTDDAVTMVRHKINPDDANHPHHNTVTIQPPPKPPPINTVGLRQYMKAYSELSKLKLSSLVVATTAAGYIAAGPIPYDMNSTIFIATIFGTSFCSACASGYNQIYERQRDTLMKRTQLRPLVTGILSPSHAILVTTTWGIIGTTTLYYYTDPITTALGLGNILLYAGIYTPLKPYTIYNTWIGALVGAIPPLMGYTAAKHILHTESLSSSSMSNALDVVSSTTTSSSPLMSMSTELWSSFISDPIAISLVSILYFWQLPHFMALSYMYRIDYKRGGFMMVPTVPMVSRGNTNHDVILDNDLGATDSTIQTDCAGVRTANIIVRYAWYLSMVPIFSTAMDVTSSMYLLESILLNAYALRVAYKFSEQQSNQNARNVFLTSLWYLPCTLMLFLLHSKAWDDTTTNDETNTNKNILTQFVSEQIHTIRNRGRELCIHEQAIVKNAGTTTKNMTKDNTDTKEVYGDEGIDGLSEASCPIMIVRKTDPNNIHINMHQATTTAMAAARESSTK